MVRAYVLICSAKKCYNSGINHPNKGFFGFPRDEKLCKSWLNNCGRTDLEVAVVTRSNGYYKLCADHFEDKYFTDSTKTKLIRNVHPVPTIFVNNIGSLLPQGSQTLDIDLPSPDPENIVEPANLCECVLNPSELMVICDRLPINYHTNPILKKKDYAPDTISKALVNLKPETELYEIEELCRFCMNKAPQGCVEMFSKSAEACEVKQICELLMWNKIDICDRLPLKVCPQCVKDLRTCKRLMDQFKNADRYLRAIAKYSLFIGNEDDPDTEDEVNEIRDEECVKYIPKNSLVIPLENLKPALESSQSYLGDMSVKKTGPTSKLSMDGLVWKRTSFQDKKEDSTGITINKESADVIVTESEDLESTNLEVNTKSADSMTQLLQPLSDQSPEINLITAGGDLWQNNVELICNNIVILPDQESGPQKPFINSKIVSTALETEFSIPLFSFKDLKKDVQLTSSSKYVSEEHDNKEVVCESEGVVLSSELFDSELLKRISCNPSYVNCESGESDSGVTVSYKCLECCSVFTGYPTLVDHVLSTHQKITRLSCHICNKEFNNSSSLLEHIKTDHVDSEIKCSICVEEFRNKAEFTEHMRTKHFYKCLFCDAVFYKEKRLEQHVAAQHDTRTECSVCEKQLKNPQLRKLHEQAHNQDCNEICWHCGVILKTKQSLRKHLQLHSENIYMCEICDKTFKTNRHRIKHQKIHGHNIMEKKFVCELCPKRFLHRENLQAHILTHSAGKPFKCGTCGKAFRQQCLLEKHEKDHSLLGECPKVKRIRDQLSLKEAPSLSCDICGRKFYKSKSVERHRTFHFCSGNPETVKKLLDEPEVYSCGICGRSFFSKLAFQYHMGKHSGTEKPYECGFCGKAFRKHTQIKIHERVHSGKKPFTCRFCSLGCHSKAHLQTHESAHTGDRPHVCHICDKTFKTRQRFLIHSQLHQDSTVRPYQCSQCGHRFMSNQRLDSHIKDTHSKGEGQQNNQCPVCNKILATEIGLQKHIKKAHVVKVVGEEEYVEEYLEPEMNMDYFNVVIGEESKNAGDLQIEEIAYCIEPEVCIS